MPSLKIKRGTRSQLNTAASASGLAAGEPYLITDENRIAVGLSTTTYEAFGKSSEDRLELISAVAASGASSVTFTNLSSSYSHYILVCPNMYGSSNVALNMQVSTDNGSTWTSSATYNSIGYKLEGSLAYNQNVSQTSMALATYCGSSTVKACAYALIFGAGLAQKFMVTWESYYGNAASGAGYYYKTYNTNHNTTAVNALKLYPASGTLTGDFCLYGVKK
jgi:hypothetical protein